MNTKKHIFFLLCCIPFLTLRAADLNGEKAHADSLYAQEEYDKAAAIYQTVADSVQDAEVFYNLGCCHYRLDDMARAVLWFERAALLKPGDKDIRFNLELARSKTIDRITPRHEFFLVSVFRWLTQLMSLRQWAVLCIGLFAVSLLALGMFLYSDRYALRRAGFYTFVLFLLLTVLGNVCAFAQRNFAANRHSAIIMAPSVTVRSTPSESGNELFVLHEGTRVEIRDDSMKDWCEVQIADGKVGWVARKVMETI